MDAEPVSQAANDFATAISRFAANAMITVSRLCDPGAAPSVAGAVPPSVAVLPSVWALPSVATPWPAAGRA